MTRLLVTGASGLLGLNLAVQAAGRYEVFGQVNRHDLPEAPFAVRRCDLLADGAVGQLLDETRPDLVIHTAAIALLDQCEREPELAERVNAVLPDRLARETARRGLPLLFISTDAVFDGRRGSYSEQDAPNPLSVYARTKLGGEQAVLSADPHALVARVNFFGWSLRGQRSLAEFFYNNLSAGQAVNGFTDVFFCPLLVNDLAEVLLEMMARGLKGLYHAYSPECISKYEFGVRIAQAFGLDAGLIHPVPHESSGLPAARSPNLCMNSDKLQQALGLSLPGQDEGIRRFYEQYRQGYPQRLRSLAGQTA